MLLPGGKKQQCISQYRDDSSFFIRGIKKDVDEIVRILKIFSEALKIEINWESHVRTGMKSTYIDWNG